MTTPAMKVGTVEGTGSAINVPLGFVPDKVVLYNIDDAGGLDPIVTWVRGMAQGGGMLALKILDDGTDTVASHDYLTSGLVSDYAGDADKAEGFAIGTNANINASGETIVYEASRNGSGV